MKHHDFRPVSAPCTTCYVAGDHLGSMRLLTDATSNATVVAAHDFAPFGLEIQSGVGGRGTQWGLSDSTSQRFTGQERDTETGLDFFQARYMASGLGRFLSPDPANAGADFTNPQSWNGYSYVLGNPLAFTDPTGMDCGGPEALSGNCTLPDPPPPPPSDPVNIDPIGGEGTSDNPYIFPPVGYPQINPIDDSSLRSAGATLNQGALIGNDHSGSGGATYTQMAAVFFLPNWTGKNEQYCKALAQKISNLQQMLRNNAYTLETNPGNLKVEVPGAPLSDSQWGHVDLQIKYQKDLDRNIRNYQNYCGGGPPPAVLSTVIRPIHVTAPANYKIPGWLLPYVGLLPMLPVVFVF